MNLTKFALKRQITTVMIYMAILLFAVFAINRIPISLIPNLDYPQLRIVTYLGESTPNEIEQSVTAKIVSAIKSIPGINEIESASTSNNSTVALKLNRQADVSYVKFLINEELNILRSSIPASARPTITEYIPTAFDETSFMKISFSGEYNNDELNQLLTRYLINPISALKGVSGTSIQGDTRTEYELKIAKEMEDKIDIANITNLINSYGKKKLLGNWEKSDSEIKVILDGSYESLDSLLELETTLKTGQKRKLKHILTLKENSKVIQAVYRYNFEPRLLLTVEKKSKANVLKLSQEVKALIDQQRKFIPAEINLEIVENEAEKVSSEMNILYQRSAFALLIIFLVLLIFLKKLYSTLTVLISIIFSVLLTIITLYAFGIGLNIISFAGLTMGLGLMVDNAIVVYENIHRHKLLDKKSSIIIATNEVSLPIISSTLTTIIVFAPFIFLQGDLKIFYLPFVYATVISILSSLFVSFTLIPLIASKLNYRSSVKASPSLRRYKAGLSHILRFRWLVILLLIPLSYFSWKTYNENLKFGWSRNNSIDKNVYISLYLNSGSNIDLMQNIFLEFESLLEPYRESIIVDGYYTVNYARIKFRANPNSAQQANLIMLRDLAISLGYKYANVDLSVWGFGDGLSQSVSTNTYSTITIKGYNYTQLNDIAKDLASYLGKLSKRFDKIDYPYDSYYSEEIKSYEIKFDRKLLNNKGIGIQDAVYSLTNQMNRFNKSITQTIGNKEYTLKVEPDSQLSLSELQNMLVANKVALKDVSKIEVFKTAGRINNKENAYLIGIRYIFKGNNTVYRKLLDYVYDNYQLPVGYSFVKLDNASESDKEKEKQKSIIQLIFFSVLLVYMSLCALLESFKYPLVILLTVPLSLIGVVWIYYFFNQHIDSSALMGIILLSGIVVNNSIILVNHINTLSWQGIPLKTAVIQGTVDRVRPILMTSLTTILGLIPMLFVSESSQSNLWKLLSLSTIGGLIASTIFTLSITPIIYYIISNKH
ncbi:MAG: efflux RND transporter permease subunit [Candidatus Cloacimonadales bacterium]